MALVGKVHQMWIHHTSKYDSECYNFDNQNHHTKPILIPHISAFALIYESVRYFSSAKNRNPRIDEAEADVEELVRLYRKVPLLSKLAGDETEITTGTQIAARSLVFCTSQNKMTCTTGGSAGIHGQKMNQDRTIYHPSQNFEQLLVVDSEGPSLAIPPEDIQPLGDMESSRVDVDLKRYQEEPAASPEVLDRRTPLLPGKAPNGRWWEFALHGY